MSTMTNQEVNALLEEAKGNLALLKAQRLEAEATIETCDRMRMEILVRLRGAGFSIARLSGLTDLSGTTVHKILGRAK